jgi:hypothetical protein
MWACGYPAEPGYPKDLQRSFLHPSIGCERVEEPFPAMEGLEGRAFVRGLKREIRIEREKKRKEKKINVFCVA